MIVDCHTHVDLGGGNTAVSAHLAVAEMVDKCIVLADASDSTDQANEKLSEYVGQHKEKMVGFAVVEPTRNTRSTKKPAFISDKLGLSGLVLYCSNYGFHPAHSSAIQLYESAQELGLPVFFHNGDSLDTGAVLDFAQPYLLDEVARMFPDLKMVIGTMGTPFYEQTLTMVAKHKNVYADLTIRPNSIWQVYNIVVDAYELGVMNKLLFGSGFPLYTPDRCIEALLGFNKLLGDTNLPTVPRGSIRGIIERNVLELLGITE